MTRGHGRSVLSCATQFAPCSVAHAHTARPTVFAFVRDLVICYAALYSVAAMIVITMGLLQIFGFELGPIESLALAGTRLP